MLYGIWDYIKNSGKYPEAKNLTLEWVGTIPGKRESRRFEGDFMLSQKDIVEQRDYDDAIAHGGWAMDLHPADGIYSKHSSCTQWHSKGVYQIPYRCFYSKDIKNLFLAGRIISASHVAFGSTRVMLTCALGAQAVGEAAALCFKNNWKPRDVSTNENIKLLQLELNRKGQSIPRINLIDASDKVKNATISASSNLIFNGFNNSDAWQILTFSTAQLLPLEANTSYSFNFELEALEDTILEVQFRIAAENRNFTPEKTLHLEKFHLNKGLNQITFNTEAILEQKQYAFVCLMKNEAIKVRLSNERCSAIMTVQNRINKAVSNYGKQEPPKDVAIDSFEFWTPERRPNGKNLAFSVSPSLSVFESENITNSEIRPNPNGETNVWIASKEDENPSIHFSWNEEISFKKIKLFFDCDYDHALESTLMGHPEETIPFVISNYFIEDDKAKLLKKVENNYQAINEINFDNNIITKSLTFRFLRNKQNIPVSVFKISLF